MSGMARRVGRARWWPSLALAGVAFGMLGCAAGAGSTRIVVPAELPNQTFEQGMSLRWALIRDDGPVRAVGLAEAPGVGVSGSTLALYGLDRDGRIVSRGQGVVAGGFGAAALPFEVTLRPTGREERFTIHVLSFPAAKQRRG